MRKFVSSIFIRVVITWAAVLACSAIGAPGVVDTTYGTAGSFLSTINDDARGSAMQPDSKLLLAAGCPRRAPLTGKTFCVARLDTSGALDATFGASGRASFQAGDANSITEQAMRIAVQSDGKVVVGGQCSSGSTAASCVARLLANGTLDTSFATGGKLFLSSVLYFGTVKALNDGKLLVAGGCGFVGPFSSPVKMCVTKLNANGTPDTGFGTGGTFEFPYVSGSGADAALSLAVRADGVISVAGRCNSSSLISSQACMGVLNGDGTPNTTVLGGQSVAALPVLDSSNTHNSFESVAWRADGALILAGRCRRSNGSYGVCHIYLNQATSETAQGNTAEAFPIGSDPDVFLAMVDVQVLGDGQVLAFYPRVLSATSIAMGYVRYNPSLTAVNAVEHQPRSGAPNSGWGGGTVQANGDFVISGSCYPAPASSPNACAVRFSGYPSAARQCSLDIDGDGSYVATVDGLIATRVMLGLTGSAVVNGVSFPATATRTTWPALRTHLITQCQMALP